MVHVLNWTGLWGVTAKEFGKDQNIYLAERALSGVAIDEI